MDLYIGQSSSVNLWKWKLLLVLIMTHFTDFWIEPIKKSISIKESMPVRAWSPRGHFGKYHNSLCLSPQCMSIVFVFSWDDCKSQEKLETMHMQNLGGQTKTIMVFSEVAYCSYKLGLKTS